MQRGPHTKVTTAIKIILTDTVDGKVEEKLRGLTFTRFEFSLKIHDFNHV